MTEQTKQVRKWPIVLTIVFIVVGCAAWICQLTMGLLIGSGMSNTFSWGLLIAVFAFLVGFGAGSQFVASYIVLANRKDLMPYAKTAQVIALAGAIGAGVAILIDLGHPLHILAMVFGPNPTSPLTWDMIALSTFIVVAIVDLIALARDMKALKFWMVLGLIAAFALQLVEGLLFALMQARVWWHSFIMPVDFIIVAVVCGLAIAVIVCSYDSKKFKPEALRDLNIMLAGAIILHLVLAVIDLAIVCFGGSAADAGALAALVSALPLYIAELALPLIAVFVLLRNSKNLTKSMRVGGFLVVIGMLCHRLMLLYPAFGSPTLYVSLSNEPSPSWAIPASTGLYDQTGRAFEIAQGYIPNVFEWLAMLLPIGIALAVVFIGMVFAKKLAKQPESEGAKKAVASAAKPAVVEEPKAEVAASEAVAEESNSEGVATEVVVAEEVVEEAVPDAVQDDTEN